MYTLSFSPAILFESFHQSSKNTTCSQSPLSLLETKSQHFLPELGITNLCPHISPTIVAHICCNVSINSPILNSPTYSLGSPPPFGEANDECERANLDGAFLLTTAVCDLLTSCLQRESCGLNQTYNIFMTVTHPTTVVATAKMLE